ncbi:uncharacterized protein MEPE_03139 [Melanopsichium pennsylvanicum]|uniref:Uncharacterized protein n=1 Tax=Melanopsichium pennsylvanicum TaxID=63383 RepID=A0AAJ4XLL1_9BASI|nr:uncharacterized protein MEPE_03139 [Melanopsichium pennsylvanicum]
MLSHRISADSTSLACADLSLGTHSRDTCVELGPPHDKTAPSPSAGCFRARPRALSPLPPWASIGPRVVPAWRWSPPSQMLPLPSIPLISGESLPLAEFPVCGQPHCREVLEIWVLQLVVVDPKCRLPDQGPNPSDLGCNWLSRIGPLLVGRMALTTMCPYYLHCITTIKDQVARVEKTYERIDRKASAASLLVDDKGKEEDPNVDDNSTLPAFAACPACLVQTTLCFELNKSSLTLSSVASYSAPNASHN